MKKIKVLAFAGSLRKDSYNRALINTAKEVSPENMEVEIFDLAGIPLYNQDDELQVPERVKLFRQKISEADAILIATPEYNRSIPGVLKNAIDWASRPSGRNSFNDKAVATIGATGGSIVGTSAAQLHLRQIFSFLNMHPLEGLPLYVSGAEEKIRSGRVVDEETRERIRALVEALGKWAVRLGAGQQG